VSKLHGVPDQDSVGQQAQGADLVGIQAVRVQKFTLSRPLNGLFG
jgi:hypothetical protein